MGHRQETYRRATRPGRSTALISAILAAFALGACGERLPPEIARAKSLLASGSYDDAGSAARSAQDTHPDHPELWRVRIEAAHRRGDARSATRLYMTWYQKRQKHDRKVLAKLALITLWQGLRVPSARVRVATILAVERREVEKLADDVDALMTNDSDVVAAASATALLRGRPGAPRIATQLLVSEDPAARAIAVAGIGRKIGKRARSDLLYALRDGDPRVRIAGIGALAPIGDPKDTDKLVALTGDPDSDVRAAALAGLASGRRPGASAAGERALADTELSVRLAAVALLKSINDRQALERAARTSTGATAVHAYAALGGGPTPRSRQAVASAREAAGAPEMWAELVALAPAVATLLPEAEALAQLRALASHSDGRVRVAAGSALRAMRAPDAEDVLSAACTDSSADARKDALAAHLQGRFISPGVIRALADESALLRVQAAEAIWRATR